MGVSDASYFQGSLLSPLPVGKAGNTQGNSLLKYFRAASFPLKDIIHTWFSFLASMQI